MENIIMPTITKVRTGPKAKNPEEKTVPVTVYARIIDIKKISGKKVFEGGLDFVRAELRSHFAKMLAKAEK